MASTSIAANKIDRIALLGAGITVVLWASAFAGIRVGLTGYSPTSLALLRYLVASLALGIYALFNRIPLPQLRDLPMLALIGFFGFTAYNVALNVGQQEVLAGTSSFIVASAPIWMAIFASIFLRERLKIWGYLGIALSFTGVIIITIGSGKEFNFNLFALYIVAAAMLQAAYSILQKPLLKRYPPIALVSYAVWFGTLFLLVFLPQLWSEIGNASLEATGAVIYMGLFPGAIAYVAWSVALSRLPASVAGSFLYLVPAFAVLIAWLWLGEIPALMALVGGVLVAIGVYVVNRYGKMA